MSTRGRTSAVRVALPWWDTTLRGDRDRDSWTELPAMRWLTARAARLRPAVVPWREWLLAGTGLDDGGAQRFAAGPCVRASVEPASVGDATWAVAQPVHLATAIDRLRMDTTHDLAVAAEEAVELISTLNAHLAGTGRELGLVTPDLWSLRCGEPVDCTSCEPADAVGRSVRDLMPGGRDGRSVRRLMNELQMLLHEHPVNERRAQRGARAVNSLWLWGFGRMPPSAPLSLPPLATDDAWLAGLWRYHGGALLETPADASGPSQPDVRIARARPPGHLPSEALARCDSDLLAGLRRALERGSLRALAIHTGERLVELDAWSRWRFWRRPAALEPVPA